MTDTTRRRVALGTWIALVLLLGGTLALTIVNGSYSSDPFVITVAVLMMIGYGTIGAYVSSRTRNPIGWLMIAVASSFVLAGLSGEWTTYAYTTNPGGLPLRLFAAWLTSWVAIGVVAPIPFVLMLFPNGHLPSRRWRWVPIGLGCGLVVVTLASILRPGPMDLDVDAALANPTGIAGLHAILTVAVWVAGLVVLAGSLLSIVMLVSRFRRSTGEERQQIRLLAYVAAVCAVALLVAILSGIGMGPNESRALNDAAFLIFLVLVGIGVPAAIAVALLRYRLWDLDVVLKKTLVATVVVALITMVAVVAILIVGGIVVGPLSGNAVTTLIVGIAVGALAWPLLRLSSRIADRLVYGGRATPYEVLAEFSGRMADSYATDDVLPRMATILGAGAGAKSVTIWLLVGGELRPACTWPEREDGEPAALPDLAEDAFVVRHQGEQLGAITVKMHANDPMTPSKERLIRNLASQAGLVLRNVRLIEELRASRRRIVAAVDEGRRRLERNIHDGAQQQLVALSVKLRLAESLAPKDPDRATAMLRELTGDVTDALENLRDLARGIYPPLLADEGLTTAVEAQARRSPVPVRVAPDGIGRYPREVEASVYFCVLEALQNVAKYAKASLVEVALRQEGERLSFEVRDDGVGFEPASAPRGSGLQGMADRIEAVGGSFSLRSAPGHGTTVAGSVPLAPA